MYIIIQRQLREGVGGSGGRVGDVGYYQLMVQYVYIYVNSVLPVYSTLKSLGPSRLSLPG